MSRLRPFVRNLLTAGQLLPMRLGPWAGSTVATRDYRVLDEAALSATRTSDTIFVFGSGASLNALSPAEFRAFEEHDTLGFNWFVHQRFVRCDYHLVREIAQNDRDPRVWKPALATYFDLVRANPHYAHTIFVVQAGLRAINGNRAIAGRMLPEGARVYRFRSIGAQQQPSGSLRRGLARGHATLEECVNFAYVLGWARIVLVGVDLYDRRYFWLGEDETRDYDLKRGASAIDPHVQASSGLVEQLGAWAHQFRQEGVRLEVYNPRSLLADVLPVYTT